MRFTTPLIAALLACALATPSLAGEQSRAPREECFEARGRRACVAVPEKKRTARGFGLLLFLHGNGAKGRADELHLARLAVEHGYVYVAPDGIGEPVDQCSWFATDTCPPRRGDSDDSGFLAELLDSIAKKLPVDPARVYVAGYSLGGFLAHRFACDHAAKVAAVASFAGAQWKDPARCPAQGRVSALIVHGTEDPVVKYRGGEARRTGRPYPSALETASVWAAKNGCTEPIRVSARLDLDPAIAGAETAVERWKGCPPGIRVELWSLEGARHDTPAGTALAESILRFFAAYPKR